MKTDYHSKKILAMLWVMVLLAVVVGSTTNILLGQIISDQYVSQQALDQRSRVLSSLAREVTERVKRARFDILQTLDAGSLVPDGMAHVDVHALNKLVEKIIDGLSDQEYEQRMGLSSYIDELNDISQDAVLWRMEYDDLIMSIRHSRNLENAKQALVGIQEKINVDLGNDRIRSASLITQFKNQADQRDELMQQIVRQHAKYVSNRHSNILIESYNLGSLVDAVATEKNLDNLVNLKDNKIYPSLEQLKSDLYKLGLVTAGITDLLDDFSSSLFGDDYFIDKIHQTIVPGQDGLYNQRIDMLKLQEANQHIRQSLEALMSDLDVETKLLTSVLQELVSKAGKAGRSELSSVWDKVQLLAIAGMIGFLLLAFFIVRTVRNQLYVLQTLRHKSDAANLAKSQFLATISHEIRTPMNGVLGMAELLAMGDLSDKQKHQVARIRQSGEQLLKLINQILDFSRIEAGEFELDIQECRIADIVDEVMALLEKQAADKSVRLVCTPPSDEQRVRADSHCLYQVLLNVAANAVKFTDHGEVNIRYAFINDDDDGRVMLKCDVSDTGIGIAEDALDDIFNEFTQADSTTTRKYGGSGLGLSICKRLVELMDGDIHISSKEGEGTTVTFTLPLQKAEPESGCCHTESLSSVPKLSSVPTDADLEKSENGVTFPQESNSTMRVLLAEDNPVNREVAVDMLESMGCQVEVAGNGKELLSLMEENCFDLVLMDCQMPEMDGFEATRIIRERENGSNRRLPVIALTAHASGECMEKCLAYGMDDFLSKPFDTQQLGKVLARWLPLAA